MKDMIDVVLDIWAKTWEKETKRSIDWKEHTVSGVNNRLKWHFGDSHIKSQVYGLFLQLPPIKMAAAATESTAPNDNKPTIERASTSYALQPNETVSAAANRLQTQLGSEDTFILSGNVVISLKAKIDLKKKSTEVKEDNKDKEKNKDSAHKKWHMSIEDIIADLIRYAALIDEALILNSDKETIRAGLEWLKLEDGKVCLTLPKIEPAVIKAPEPVPSNVAIVEKMGLNGSNGTGVAPNLTAEVVAPIPVSNPTPS